MHCWCPPATGPGQPHESDCVQYKRPPFHFNVKVPLFPVGKYYFKTAPTLPPGSFGQYGQYGHVQYYQAIDAQAYAAAVKAVCAEDSVDAAVDFIDFGPIQLHPMGLSQKEKQSLAYVQAHAMAAKAKAAQAAETYDVPDDPGPYDPADVVNDKV
jgi:hypothetical protein